MRNRNFLNARRVCGLLVATVFLVLAPITTGAFSAGSDADGPGCHRDWPVVAHHAGGKVVQDATALTVCANETGYYTGETKIGVTASGTIWIQAADWEWALARSNDDGATWTDWTVQGPQAWPGCEIAPARC